MNLSQTVVCARYHPQMNTVSSFYASITRLLAQLEPSVQILQPTDSSLNWLEWFKKILGSFSNIQDSTNNKWRLLVLGDWNPTDKDVIQRSLEEALSSIGSIHVEVIIVQIQLQATGDIKEASTLPLSCWAPLVIGSHSSLLLVPCPQKVFMDDLLPSLLHHVFKITQLQNLLQQVDRRFYYCQGPCAVLQVQNDATRFNEDIAVTALHPLASLDKTKAELKIKPVGSKRMQSVDGTFHFLFLQLTVSYPSHQTKILDHHGIVKAFGSGLRHQLQSIKDSGQQDRFIMFLQQFLQTLRSHPARLFPDVPTSALLQHQSDVHEDLLLLLDDSCLSVPLESKVRNLIVESMHHLHGPHPKPTPGGRSYEPYLTVTSPPNSTSVSVKAPWNRLSRILERMHRPSVSRVLSGRISGFRDPGWECPFEDDVKVWEDAERGSFKKRRKTFGSGLEMVEF